MSDGVHLDGGPLDKVVDQVLQKVEEFFTAKKRGPSVRTGSEGKRLHYGSAGPSGDGCYGGGRSSRGGMGGGRGGRGQRWRLWGLADRLCVADMPATKPVGILAMEC